MKEHLKKNITSRVTVRRTKPLAELRDQVFAHGEKATDECPICFDRRLDTILVPCQHMICSHCILKLQEGRCPMCRAEVVSERLGCLPPCSDFGMEVGQFVEIPATHRHGVVIARVFEVLL